MTNKAEMIAIIKAENPTLRLGDDEQGYTDLSPADYEAQIELWADNRLVKEAAAAQAATDKAALLAKLGLTADQLKTLLS